MQDSLIHILFLGENHSWQKLSHSLSDDIPLQLHRLDSLADLFQALATGRWQGLVIDIHAWNFRGLHYIEKVRAQYPSFPIIALYSSAIPGLDAKSTSCGASRSIPFTEFSAASVHSAIDSALADVDSQFLLEKTPPPDLQPIDSNGVTVTFSKNQVITHALNNLLCVISANADLLSDALNGAASINPPLTEIKKAARSASALMRHLK